MIPSIYINLEDDVSKVVARLKKEKAGELVLVCPKRCFLFNDGINLKLLKKQTDLLGKKVYILTMDEKGQAFAREAGFELKTLPKVGSQLGMSDIAKRPQAAIKAGKKAEPTFFAESAKKTSAKNSKATVDATTTNPEELLELEVPQEKTENIFPRELENVYSRNKSKKRHVRALWVFVLTAFLVTFAVLFLLLPKAQIGLFLKSQKITRDFVVTASVQATEVSPDTLTIPGQNLTQNLELSEKFQSQGKKEVGNKASGTVVIYNFTGTTLNLRAKTTVLTLNNKNYLLKTDALQLRPTRYKNAKTKEIDESSLDAPVEIEAAAGGESYNIPAGTRVEVTNQVLGSRPQQVYAKAVTSITGGTSRYLSYITNEDLTAAKTALQNKIHSEISRQLQTKNLILEPEAMKIVDPKFTFDYEAGTETPSFSGKLSAQVIAIAYKRENMEKMILDRVKQSLTSDSPVDIELTQILVKSRPADFNASTTIMDAHFEGLAIAPKPDLNELKSNLAGKSETEAVKYIKSKADLEKVEITLVPSWQKWMPFLKRNLSLNLERQ